MNFSFDDGRELSVETPMITNVIPFVGLGIGYAVGRFIFNKSNETSLLFATVGLGIGVIPKIYYYTKAVKDFRKETIEQKNTEQLKKELDLYNEDDSPVSTEKIIVQMKKITSQNNLLHNFLPKENYFFDVIDNFPQKDKDILNALLENIDNMPDEPDENDILSFTENIKALENEYGKEDVDRVNFKLTEINNYLNEILEPQTSAV
jgi:hypothetical protein